MIMKKAMMMEVKEEYVREISKLWCENDLLVRIVKLT